MVRSTSMVGAFCLALLLPALADAQGFGIQNAGAEDIGARLVSRRIAAAAYAAVPSLPASDAHVESCRTETSSDRDGQDARWQWRLNAFRHLDCVTTLIDNALAAAVREDGPAPREVRIPREDLERMRTLAWWARDAAARIGQ
jgi:hypothetical protein